MSRQDRQGARTPAQLNQQFQFGKTFAELKGLAEDAQKLAEEANETGKRTESKVERLDDRITLAVQMTSEAQSLAEDATKAANDAKEEILSQAAIFELRAEGIDLSVTELRQEVGTKADQAQVNEITEHFRFSDDGMTITNSATGMGINVSEQQVAFTGGNDPTTVITPNAMETTNLSVGVRLDVGGYSLIPRSNGNLSLRWTGG